MMISVQAATDSCPLATQFCAAENPLDKKCDLITSIYALALSAFYAYKNGAIPDPIVGDEGCQMRAYKLATIVNTPHFSEEIALSLHELQTKITVLQEIKHAGHLLQDDFKIRTEDDMTAIRQLTAQKKKLERSKDPAASLKIAEMTRSIQELQQKIAPSLQWLENERARLSAKFPHDLSVSSDVMFYFLSHILTAAKVCSVSTASTGEKIGHDRLDTDLLRAAFPPDCKLVKRDLKVIGKIAQQKLAELSVDFIQKEALACTSADKELLMQMSARIRWIEHPGHGKHPELPCYHLTRIIFQRALEREIPIILKVRSSTVDPYQSKGFVQKTVFAVHPLKMVYSVADPAMISPHTPVIVMECRTNRPSELISGAAYVEEVVARTGGVISLIEYLVAQHHQYTDLKTTLKEQYEGIENLPEAETMRLLVMAKQASALGIAPQNPFLCCPEHIYCNSLGNEM